MSLKIATISKHKPLYNIVTYKDKLYYRLRGSIHGWHKCCSAAVFSSVYAYARTSSRNFKRQRRSLDEALLRTHTDNLKPVPSLSHYIKRREDHIKSISHLDLPMDYCHAALLERIHTKAATGTGGVNMWGNNEYNACTWAMADRERGPDELTVYSFGQYLTRTCEEHKIGRIVSIKQARGAHGGLIDSWLFTPHLTLLRDFLNHRVKEINEHLLWLNDYREALKEKYPDVRAEITENEIIHEQW